MANSFLETTAAPSAYQELGFPFQGGLYVLRSMRYHRAGGPTVLQSLWQAVLRRTGEGALLAKSCSGARPLGWHSVAGTVSLQCARGFGLVDHFYRIDTAFGSGERSR